MRKICFIAFMVLVGICFVDRVRAETILPIVIESDMTLTAEHSPYVLIDNTVVEQGVVLTVGSGVTVQFEDYVFDISGHVHILGSESNPVLFTSSGSGILSISNHDTETKVSHAVFDRVQFSQTYGRVDIDNSVFKNSLVGISMFRTFFHIKDSAISDNSVGLLVQDERPFLMWLFRTARADSSNYVIENSQIENNNIDIRNLSKGIVDARNNWWGIPSGPSADLLVGDVLIDPWLTEVPRSKRCCSSIVFLPGIQSSRLYEEGIIFENQLWEPNRETDVEKLFMSPSGESMREDIYTRDIIETTNITGIGGKDLYKSISDSFRALQQKGNIDAWKAVPYDWRFSPDTIIERTELIKIVKELASSSYTGKVTIVAHSAGGLVTKRFIQILEENELDRLIDVVVFVAVPHFGTPKAYASLLYGEGQELGYGFILSKDTAQKLSVNMPMAYNLIPSRRYFNFEHPTFVSGLLSVSTWESFSEIFSEYNDFLWNKAQNMHDRIDTWNPPEQIDVHTLIGNHRPTLRGIRYIGKDRRPSFSLNGDGTVMVPSALGGGGTQHFFDLSLYAHADILEDSKVLACVVAIVIEEECVSDVAESYDGEVITVLSVHSPVHIRVQDEFGHVTSMVEESIPNSAYMEFGEGKYVALAGSPSVDISLIGTGEGFFDFEVEQITSTSTTLIYALQDIPIYYDQKVEYRLSEEGIVQDMFVEPVLLQKTTPVSVATPIVSTTTEIILSVDTAEKDNTSDLFKDVYIQEIISIVLIFIRNLDFII